MSIYKCVLFAAAVLLSAGAVYPQGLAEKLSELEGSLSPSLNEWRYKPEDVPGAHSPDFDDSSWSIGSPEFTWGGQPVAWMRKKITIPDRVAGFPVAGSEVTLRVGIDDEGVIYVNGEEAERFKWDSGAAVLTRKAVPGEQISIAIKGINGPGPGRMLFARLEFSTLRETAAGIRAFIQDYQELRRGLEDPDLKDRCQKAISAVEEGLDMEAVDSGDIGRLIESLKEARSAALSILGDIPKGRTIHLVGHAHIDMNWLWLWPETVQVCKDTFSSVLSIMDEFPEFKFSQSQASTYLAMEEYHPDIFARIKEQVKAGRWEITGGTWVEGDMNMASGESIVRQIMYAKRYFLEKFGVEPRICWEPDTFGHAATIPQILAKSGLKYYYFCRAGKGKRLFWWEAPDGSRVLAYNDDSYNGAISQDIARKALEAKRDLGLDCSLYVYGVGDHGGGPTRADINRARELQQRAIFPKVKFSTAEEFFRAVEAAHPDLPVIKDELNFVFEGCYTTHADAKKWNRECENLLPAAEAISAIAADYRTSYPRDEFVRAWRNTCFNQFHDIFDGSAIHGSYEYSRRLYEEAITIGRKALLAGARAIAQNIDTNGPGLPIVVFNPLSWQRDDIVTLSATATKEPVDLLVTDGEKSWPVQVIGDALIFVARDVPPFGYKVFWLGKGSIKESGVSWTETTIENQFYRVTVDPATAVITSIYDKMANREVLPPGGRSAVPLILLEEPHGMSAWNIGPIRETIEPPRVEVNEIIDSGPVSVSVQLDHRYNESIITQDVTLYDDIPRIDIKTTVDWKEQGTPEKPAPMLKVAFPVAIDKPKATFEIPFGSIERDANGHEVPAQKWIDLSDASYGVSLLNDCKYGHDVKDATMRLTLLRSSYDPDPVPDQGIHEMTYSLYPHQGDWRKAGTVRRAYELNNPLVAVRAEKHGGSLPRSHSFLSVSPTNLVVTALKKAEDSDDLIIRFYDATGEGGRAMVRTSLPLKSWVEADMAECEIGKPAAIEDGSFTVDVGRYEIKTIRLKR